MNNEIGVVIPVSDLKLILECLEYSYNNIRELRTPLPSILCTKQIDNKLHDIEQIGFRIKKHIEKNEKLSKGEL